MAIYEIKSDAITEMDETSFQKVGLQERSDLQRLLRAQIEVICADTLVIAEEFGEWDESRRRIDLLGLDKDANLIVIELKRTEDGGHMELQALRYAAMVSAMTFDRAVQAYGSYLRQTNSDLDPRESILGFLGWDEANEEGFAQNIRIVLVSADFSKELTTSVMWLNERDLDIRCIRMKPYSDSGRVLVDVQQVIPLPEAEQYQIQLKQKTRKERSARQGGRDYTKYDVTINAKTYTHLTKGRTAFVIIKQLCDSGLTPDEITAAASFRRGNVFRGVDGEVNSSEEFISKAVAEQAAGGRRFDPWRFFTDDEELVHCDGRTYAISRQWGPRTEMWIDEILAAFPGRGIDWRRSGDDE